ncbi:putative clathrin assembly protein At1g25240 [Phragmites australis]|uniref:putative clathrin assembly protein At1g25240 n=1 Tax=Phragmites australis TaxID=29695 RepID=UPI002D7714C9|nr:putative clathrin assembly protein At1g25240 [Phragmites australis]
MPTNWRHLLRFPSLTACHVLGASFFFRPADFVGHLFLQAFLPDTSSSREEITSGVELATVVDLIFPGRVELGGAREGGGDARWWGCGAEGPGGQQAMTTARQLWRRAAAAVKDRRSLYLTRVAALRQASGVAAALRSPELEAAVIRATSHDERSVDYGSAARVFALARASPSALQPLMWSLARRAGRTRCWAVALKALMLAHGLLLRSDLAPRAARLGRVPLDLADFRDRSSPPSKSSGFSAFVRAYFRFLDTRSLFAAQELDGTSSEADDEGARLDRVTKLQHLLDLLMQIRPYGDGMEQGLILEAMDCVVIEIFEVYSQICTGIARLLVAILGSAPTMPRPRPGETVAAARRQRGVQGMRVLRKAADQSAQLSSYFELCRGLGVLNAAELPAVERVSDDDIRDLEKLIISHVVEGGSEEAEENNGKALVAVENAGMESKTVVTKEWVVFDDDDNAGSGVRQGHFGNYVNPFLGAPWAAVAGSGDVLV